MSALPPEADIRQPIERVCFVPKADLNTPPATGNDAQPSGVWHEITCILISTQACEES